MFYGQSDVPYIPVKDAAQMLRVNPFTLYRNMDQIPHIKLGNEYRIACWFLLLEPPPIHVFKHDYEHDTFYQPPLPFVYKPQRRWANTRRLVHLDPFGDPLRAPASRR